MIICTLVVFKQLNYIKNMDQGFDQKNVIGLQLESANDPEISCFETSPA